MHDKFSYEARTFETRLKFIIDIFSDLFPPEAIMAKCVQHKLDRSLLAYVETLHLAILDSNGEDPLEVLKQLD